MSEASVEPANPILNVELVRDRCYALDISQVQLAAELRVGWPVIKALRTGTNHGRLSLRFVARLAEVLCVPVEQLFETAEEAAEPRNDDVCVEAAMREVDGRLHQDEIARAFGWDPVRTSSALEALKQRLKGTGTALRGPASGYWELVAAVGVLAPDLTKRVLRSPVDRNLDVAGVRLLRRALDGPVKLGGIMKGPTHIQRSKLLRMGLIQPEPDGLTARISPEVAYSLGLDHAADEESTSGTSAGRARA